jgi:hypothetical protein
MHLLSRIPKANLTKADPVTKSPSSGSRDNYTALDYNPARQHQKRSLSQEIKRTPATNTYLVILSSSPPPAASVPSCGINLASID